MSSGLRLVVARVPPLSDFDGASAPITLIPVTVSPSLIPVEPPPASRKNTGHGSSNTVICSVRFTVLSGRGLGAGRRDTVCSLPCFTYLRSSDKWGRSPLLLVQLLRELREQADEGIDGEIPAESPSNGGRNPKRSQASMLVDLVIDSGALLFHDERIEPYVALPMERREIWALGTRTVRRWLARLFWQLVNKAPSGETLATAVNLLSSMAIFDGPEYPLSVRVAWREGALYYDLGDWTAVKITPQGWEILEDPPILFRHFQHQGVHPEPRFGGNFHRIYDFFSPTRTEDDTVLLGTTMLADLIPGSPRPAVSFAGPHGSGKSTAAKVVKRVVDPSRAKSIRRITDFRELQLLFEQNWLLNIDNLDGLKPEISDAFAAAITGDSDLRRVLYTDQDLLLLDYMRPMLLNGISHPVERPDLLDRTILITLERISENLRREEEEMWAEFEAVLPDILGGAFDILARAMVIRPTVRIGTKPRMADFAVWGYAIAEAAGWGGAAFLAAYEHPRNVIKMAVP